MTLTLLVLVVAVSGASGAVRAAGDVELTDWTAADTTADTASGTVRGVTVALSGTDVQAGAELDGGFTGFAAAHFSPPAANTDAIAFAATDGSSYQLTFGAPVTDPIIHLASLGSVLEFSAGTSVSKVSGQPTFSVAGTEVRGAAGAAGAPNNDANGTIRLSGSFSTIQFTATPLPEFPNGDGVYLQIGVPEPAPPATPTPTPTPTATPGPGPGPAPSPAAPAAPTVTRITGPADRVARHAPTTLTADVTGEWTSIAWNLDAGPEPEIVGNPGERSIVVRPALTLTVTATATGPGGTGPASAPFTVGIKHTRLLIPKPVAKQITNLPVTAIPVTGRETIGEIFDECRSFNGFSRVRAGGALDVSGCLVPITSVAQVPASELGVLAEISRRAGLEPTRVNLDRLLATAAAYRAPRLLSVNGILVTPRPGSSTLVLPQLNALGSSGADLSVAGKIPLQSPGRFLLNTAAGAAGRTIDLGRFARLPGALKDIGGFKLSGVEVDVKLIGRRGFASATSKPFAQITVSLSLPSFMRGAGITAEAEVKLTASVDNGLVIDAVRIGPIAADIGALKVEELQLTYDNTPGVREWRGQGKACVLTEGVCLDMTPENAGGVTIRGEQLLYAGATLGFSPPLPLFTGIELNSIGFALGLEPTRLFSDASIRASGTYDIKGKLIVAFPSQSVPFRFVRDEVGPNFPASFYGRAHSMPTIGASADATVEVPVLGKIPLGRGYFLYEHPGFVAFGGDTKTGLPGVVSFGGRLDGEFNALTGRFNLSGEARGCIDVLRDELPPWFDLCRGFEGAISDRGLAACIEMGIKFGVAIGFRPRDIIPYLLGCDVGRFRQPNVRDRPAARQTSGETLIRVAAGDPSRSIKVDGVGGAPALRVIGPDGTIVDGSGTITETDHIAMVRVAKLGTTVVGLRDPEPGVYRITPLEGSVPVGEVLEADVLPPARITGKVSGRGTQRVLDYNVLAREGQVVTFMDVSPGGGAREIGRTSAGGKGRMRFTANPGEGEAHIEARIELQGRPSVQPPLVVARYDAPSVHLGRPGGMTATRRGKRTRVAWKRVAGARGYEVTVAALGVPGTSRTTRRPRLNIALPRTSAARISVRAVDGVRSGPGASVRVRRAAPLVNRLRKVRR